MIEVVISREKAPIISIEEIKGEQGIYVAKVDKDYYILIKEPNGWIFRMWNNHGLGHSGIHKTIPETIKHALQVRRTSVFQFDNFKEAFWFCSSKE